MQQICKENADQYVKFAEYAHKYAKQHAQNMTQNM